LYLIISTAGRSAEQEQEIRAVQNQRLTFFQTFEQAVEFAVRSERDDYVASEQSGA